MDPFLTFLAAIIGGMLLFGGVYAWIEHRAEVRRRELTHIERMKAIECGYPLPDEDATRAKALGWIGAVGPAASLAAAAWGTWLILGRDALDAPRWLLAVVWPVCGAVGVVAAGAAVLRMRPRPAVRVPHQSPAEAVGAVTNGQS